MRAIGKHAEALGRAVLAMLPPALVLVLQLAVWRLFEPYAWFMFVPALFLSARVARPRVAILVSAATTLAIWWFFVPPYGALGKDARHALPAIVFFSTAIVFSAFHERLRRARNAKSAARDAESRLASLVEQAPDGVFVADLEGRYVDVNPSACRMLGYTRDELLGMSIVDLLRPEDVPRLRASRERLLDGRIEVGEWLLRRKDGVLVPVEVSARIPPRGRWQAVVRDVSERHRIERELRERQADLRSAQALAKIGSWRVDVTRGEIVWSEETHRIFGTPRGTELSYETFLDAVHPDDREYVDRMWRAAMQGAHYDIEHRLLIDGEVKWVRERAELVVDEQGQVHGGIGTTQDVTDRKRIELALQDAERRAVESANRIRALSDAAAAINDAVARLPDASVESVMDVIGAQARLLVGTQYVAIGVGTDPSAPFEHWIELGTIPEHVSAAGRAVLRVPIRHRGGIVGDLFLAREHDAPPFTDDDERLVDLLASRAGAALEIARLYRKVALSRAWMHTVVDQMPEGVLLLDASGHVVADNRSLRAYAPAGERARDPFGNPVPLDLLCADGQSLAPDEMPYVAAIVRGERFAGREHQVRRRDGSVVAVLVGVSPVLSDAGELTGAVMIVQDVSTLKELERLREEWTSVVAHDLRQPVNVITLAAGMLAETRVPLPEDKRRWAIASIGRSAGTLDRMIGDLLDASRIEARRITVERREASLATLVRDVVDRVPGAGACCDVDVAPGADRAVLADPVRIEQVLTNLLTNALKYGEPGARIGVRLVPREREVEAIVTNRGPGIPPDELPKLFRRFERTRSARAGRERGIGLGLYLSKGLIEAHGGRIWAESTPGAETSFHFTVPYAPRAQAELAHA
ncbi:PAS domain S-box protein [Sandaracinus amylolyticus]|uniref:histidine kinase n=1 Tax=Sandaracinus amylolyticus TaxID=927083 RepID=A0A0F6SDY2_9BACT|nr:PAS domain S-box protein [Sandaracinus amylolyticus]AKF04239.1 Osmosensitive K+ channel histidine kinase kdpD [Sandaracinus amylolyticus]